jgi:hypothetical protein
MLNNRLAMMNFPVWFSVLPMSSMMRRTSPHGSSGVIRGPAHRAAAHDRSCSNRRITRRALLNEPARSCSWRTIQTAGEGTGGTCMPRKESRKFIYGITLLSG